MKLFLDTYFFLALVNPKDPSHREAVDWASVTHRPRITTTAVLLEIGDALCSPINRPKCLALVEELKRDPGVIIIPHTDELFEDAMRLFAARPDKDWPLTDCISFTVMTDMGVTDALTADDHFRQAGFNPLFMRP